MDDEQGYPCDETETSICLSDSVCVLIDTNGIGVLPKALAQACACSCYSHPYEAISILTRRVNKPWYQNMSASRDWGTPHQELFPHLKWPINFMIPHDFETRRKTLAVPRNTLLSKGSEIPTDWAVDNLKSIYYYINVHSGLLECSHQTTNRVPSGNQTWQWTIP